MMWIVEGRLGAVTSSAGPDAAEDKQIQAK